jgi:ABC-type transport system involved in cytochrome c biogenesis permease subunit
MNIITTIILALAGTVSATPDFPDSLDLTEIRSMVVQHDGRWMPLDTLARDYVENITGEEFYLDRDPVLVLLSWTFNSQAWKEVRLISIKNAELRAEIQLPESQTVFSYAELVRHKRLHFLVDKLDQVEPGRKINPLESKVSGINKKLIVLQKVFFSQAIKPVPNPEDALGPWQPVSWFLQGRSEELKSLQDAWLALQGAFLADNPEAFDRASGQLIASLERLPAAHRPSQERIAIELGYNRLKPFRIAWLIMAAGAVLAAIAMGVRRWWFDGLALVALIAGFGMLTYGLFLRGTIAGRLPAANMFESLLFLSWGMGAFAIIALLFFRHRSVPLTASAMGALSLCLADSLPMDHFIRPIVPVLMDTVWMSIHVPIIIVSYSVLALAVLIAHVQLISMAAAPQRRHIAEAIDTVHRWYIHIGSFLLFIGIVTGSMWAASSWGRYWGWDPKEVWSLVAFLGYMAILHVRARKEGLPRWAYAAGAVLALAVSVFVLLKLSPLTFPKLLAFTAACGAMVFFVTARGKFATAVKSILAFWMIIMTYVGVNYVLGIGLHSYGFGTGAIASRVFLIGGVDLAVVAICFLVYFLRRRSSAVCQTA